MPCPLAHKNSELSGRVGRDSNGAWRCVPASCAREKLCHPSPPPSYCSPCQSAVHCPLRYKNGTRRKQKCLAARGFVSREKIIYSCAVPSARASLPYLHGRHIWWCRVCRAVARAATGVRRPPAPRRESASRPVCLQANDLDARHTLPRVTQCHNSVTVRKYV